MERVTVWTKQHRLVWETLQRAGRYTAKGDGIFRNEDALLMKPAYDWLVSCHPDRARKPADAEYPVWVSSRQDATMLLSPDTVVLELSLDPGLVTYINIAKWGMVNNFSYIPADPQDDRRHRSLLASLGVSDPEAVMSRFYPELKAEIEGSWLRAFDDAVEIGPLGSRKAYGLIWELRREWVQNVEAAPTTYAPAEPL